MSQFDLVIFDCDGTLVDSEALNNAASSEILIEAGFPEYTPLLCMEKFVGLAQPVIWAMIEREAGRPLPADINRRYIHHIAAVRDRYLKPAPGARDVVVRVMKTHKICVTSNGEPENVRGAIIAAGLADLFSPEYIFTASQVKNPKPAPDLFLYAAEIMGAMPERTLVIEDSLAGAAAGVAAGMTVFGYTGLAHDAGIQGSALKNLGVDFVSDNLADILTILKYGNISGPVIKRLDFTHDHL